MIAGTIVPQTAQEGHQLPHRPLVEAVPRRNRVQPIKHLEQQRRRRVNRTNNRPSLLGQPLQQRNTLRTRRTIQTRSRLIQKQNRRVRDHLQGDREALLLAPGESPRWGVALLLQSQHKQDFLDQFLLFLARDAEAQLEVGCTTHRFVHR